MLLIVYLISVALTISIARRTSPFSPASISAGFATISLLPLFFSYEFDVDYDSIVRGLVFKPIELYFDMMWIVVLIHFSIVLVSFLAILGLARERVVGVNFSRIFLSGQTILHRWSTGIVFGLFLLLMLNLGHFLSIDQKHLLWQNQTYRDIVRPDILGFRFAPFAMMHLLLGPLAVLTVCTSYLFWQSRQMVPFMLSMASFLYYYIIILAQFSRFAPLTVFVVMALAAAIRRARGQSVFSPFTVSMFFLTAWLFIFAFAGRSSSVHGIAGILPTLFSMEYAGDGASDIVLNIGLGAYDLAEAIRSGPYSYDPKYALLSFSMFPSFLDGWLSVVDSYHRHTEFVPFSAYAELYYFGWVPSIVFAVVYGLCIRALTKAALQLGDFLGLLVCSPAIFAILAFHQYPLRMGFRLLVYTSIMARIITIVMKARQRRGVMVPTPSAPQSMARLAR